MFYKGEQAPALALHAAAAPQSIRGPLAVHKRIHNVTFTDTTGQQIPNMQPEIDHTAVLKVAISSAIFFADYCLFYDSVFISERSLFMQTSRTNPTDLKCRFDIWDSLGGLEVWDSSPPKYQSIFGIGLVGL